MTKRTATRNATGILLGLWFLTTTAPLGCDDATENRQVGPTPAPPTPATSEKKPTPKRPPPTKTSDDLMPVAGTNQGGGPKSADISSIVRNYSGCYSGCFKETGSATNRETCKLNCDSVAESALEGLTGGPPRGKFQEAIGSFTSCVNSCYADKTLNRTNRETCVLTCQDTAEVSVASPIK